MNRVTSEELWILGDLRELAFLPRVMRVGREQACYQLVPAQCFMELNYFGEVSRRQSSYIARIYDQIRGGQQKRISIV
jgi:hypothetical protein